MPGAAADFDGVWPQALQQVDRTYVRWRGQRLSYFGGCDYFRLSSHPRVMAAMEAGMREFGLNVAASRATTGNHRLYEELEEALAGFFRVESTLLTSTGYLTNLAVGEWLGSQCEYVLLDERAHPSLGHGARMMGKEVKTYRHLDSAEVRRQLTGCGREPAALFTDGVFATDGGLAPLRSIGGALREKDWLVVDEAHSAGVMGKRGGGVLEMSGLQRERCLRTMTLSKGFGVFGGAILGSRGVIREIAKTATVKGHTPMPLPLAAAALESVRLLNENGEWLSRLRENVVRVRSRAGMGEGGNLESTSPILVVRPESREEKHRLEQALDRYGIFSSFIRYPGVDGDGLFRFAISSEHEVEQLEGLGEALWVRTGANSVG